MATTVKRLYKSRTDRMVNGICGGIAEYYEVDATLVRLAFIFLLFMGGLGFFLYVIAMIIVPSNPGPAEPSTATRPSPGDSSRGWGIVLIAIGGLLFLGNIGFPLFHWWHIPWGIAVPIVLILAGIAVLLTRGRVAPEAPSGEGTPEAEAPEAHANGTARLYRSRRESKLFGVCGGIGTYLNTDPTIVRIIFVAAAFASAGLMVLLYLILAIVVPLEPSVPAAA
jgi:phage shock protein C